MVLSPSLHATLQQINFNKIVKNQKNSTVILMKGLKRRGNEYIYGNAYSQNTKKIFLQRAYLKKSKIKKKESFLKDLRAAMKTDLSLFFLKRLQPRKFDLHSIH